MQVTVDGGDADGSSSPGSDGGVQQHQQTAAAGARAGAGVGAISGGGSSASGGSSSSGDRAPSKVAGKAAEQGGAGEVDVGAVLHKDQGQEHRQQPV
jgi:hypothetical protein